MARRPEAYVDTSALIAFADRSDSHHPLFRRLFGDPPELFTSTLVVAEGHGWFLKRYDRLRARRFRAMVEDMAPLRVLEVGAHEQSGAKVPRPFARGARALLRQAHRRRPHGARRGGAVDAGRATRRARIK